MSKGLKLFVVGLALILELYFLLLANTWLHGPILDVQYRHQERREAFYDYHLHPSPATKTILDEEVVRMNRYLDLRMLVMLGALIVIDGIGLYWLRASAPKTSPVGLIVGICAVAFILWVMLFIYV